MDNIPQIKPDKNVVDTQAAKQIISAKSVILPEVNPSQSVSQEISNNSENSKGKFKFTPKHKKILTISGVFIIIILFAVIVPLVNLYLKSKPLIASGRKMADTVKSQDLNLIKLGLEDVNTNLKPALAAYKFVSWMRIFPYAGGYIKDLGHVLKGGDHGIKLGALVLTTVEPYADFLGLKTKETTNGEQTAQERIDFILLRFPILQKMQMKLHGK